VALAVVVLAMLAVAGLLRQVLELLVKVTLVATGFTLVVILILAVAVAVLAALVRLAMAQTTEMVVQVFLLLSQALP
jgi:hypothetical protein